MRMFNSEPFAGQKMLYECCNFLIKQKLKITRVAVTFFPSRKKKKYQVNHGCKVTRTKLFFNFETRKKMFCGQIYTHNSMYYEDETINNGQYRYTTLYYYSYQ